MAQKVYPSEDPHPIIVDILSELKKHHIPWATIGNHTLRVRTLIIQKVKGTRLIASAPLIDTFQNGYGYFSSYYTAEAGLSPVQIQSSER